MRCNVRALAILITVVAAADSSQAESDRSIALVLDASGSMNARMADGTTRIDGAKSAVAILVESLSGDTRLALRVYGDRSPTRDKNCTDTTMLVPFDAVASNKSAVVERARGIRAQGYTPITYVLKLAAEDVGKEESGARQVVLVSDGKETCPGDPCATAKALAAADAKLVIHTIGLGVDAAARYQLQCIASVARGLYSDAGTTGELVKALGKTVEAAPLRKAVEVTMTNKLGKIRIEGAPAAYHEVLDAASGKEAALINTGHPGEVELPPGVYNVKFANGFWMGVEVKPGATTNLKPGFLKIEGRDLWGNKLLDPETEEIVGETSAGFDRIALLPTRVLVTFGNRSTVVWPETVEIREGSTTTLRPGRLHVRYAKTFKGIVKGPDGEVASEISSAVHTIALPPGKYSLELGGDTVPIELGEGQDLQINLP